MSKKNTVTMFVVDLSPRMGDVKVVDCVPGLVRGKKKTSATEEITHLEWGLRYVKKKIQEKIIHGDKTDRCGVVVYGSEYTDNVINTKRGGYEDVQTYLDINVAQPYMLSRLDELKPSESSPGDSIDGLIVALEIQSRYLAKARSWAREIVLITNGNSQFNQNDWEVVVRKINTEKVGLTVVGIDFDVNAETRWYGQRGGGKKSAVKKSNEELFGKMVKGMTGKKAVIQNLAQASNDVAPPRIKVIKSTLVSATLRIGDPTVTADERYPMVDGADAIEIAVKTSKATAVQRAASMKKFTRLEVEREEDPDAMDVDQEDEVQHEEMYAEVKARTVYAFEMPEDEEDEGEMSGSMQETSSSKGKERQMQEVEKEEVVRGFKYGVSFVPLHDDAAHFPKLHTKAGMTICGFFPLEKFRPELAVGETHYVWGDPKSPQAQVALSSFARVMRDDKKVAIAKWVQRDGADAKMGVLIGSVNASGKADYMLWTQMPFADDLRRYAFASLDKLVSKEGKKVEKHAFRPTKKQCDAMDAFVDSMDLMGMGEKNGNGKRPWFDPRESFNPAIHRTKEAMLHVAAVPDLKTHPLPPPHPDLTKFFRPPERVVKRSKAPLEACIKAFDVKKVPKRVAKAKAQAYSLAAEVNDSQVLLLDLLDQPKAAGKKDHPVTSTSAKPKMQGLSLAAEGDSSQGFLLDLVDEAAEVELPKPVVTKHLRFEAGPSTLGKASAAGRLTIAKLKGQGKHAEYSTTESESEVESVNRKSVPDERAANAAKTSATPGKLTTEGQNGSDPTATVWTPTLLSAPRVIAKAKPVRDAAIVVAKRGHETLPLRQQKGVDSRSGNLVPFTSAKPTVATQGSKEDDESVTEDESEEETLVNPAKPNGEGAKDDESVTESESDVEGSTRVFNKKFTLGDKSNSTIQGKDRKSDDESVPGSESDEEELSLDWKPAQRSGAVAPSRIFGRSQ